MRRSTLIFLIGSVCILIGLFAINVQFARESAYPAGAPWNVMLAKSTASLEDLRTVESAFAAVGLLWASIGIGLNYVAIRLRRNGR